MNVPTEKLRKLNKQKNENGILIVVVKVGKPGNILEDGSLDLATAAEVGAEADTAGGVVDTLPTHDIAIIETLAMIHIELITALKINGHLKTPRDEAAHEGYSTVTSGPSPQISSLISKRLSHLT